MFRRILNKIKIKILSIATLGCVIATFVISPMVYPLYNDPEPEGTLRFYFEKWQKISENNVLSESGKEEELLQLIEEVFYIKRLSRQFLQKVWKEMSPYNLSRFNKALETSILRKVKSSMFLDFSNRPWKATLLGKEVKEKIATFTFNVTGRTRKLHIQVFMLKNPEGFWKVTNLKIEKNSLMRYYYNLCKNTLDEYSLQYLITKLGDYNYVVLEDFESGPVDSLPLGWNWKSKDDKKHKPYRVKTENNNKYLEATDQGESVIIGKTVKWNLRKFPYITFKWRAHRIPEGGDERFGKTVDSAAGIYFTYKKKLGLIPVSVKYVWSSTLPVGSAMRRSGIGKPWMVVADSGADNLGEWRTYVFNAYQAYKDTYGGNPPEAPLGIGILSDANSTHSFAYADYDDIRALKDANADSGIKKILDAE